MLKVNLLAIYSKNTIFVGNSVILTKVQCRLEVGSNFEQIDKKPIIKQLRVIFIFDLVVQIVG